MPNSKETNSLDNLKTVILIFMVAVYPLIVVPVPEPFSYFLLARYFILSVIALIALVVFILDRKKNKLNHPAYITLSLFFVFLLVSSLLAEIPLMALIGSPWRFTGLSTYLSCIFLFLLASQHNNPKQILRPMIFCAAVVSLIGVMQFYGYNFIPHHIYPSGSQGYSSAYSTIGNTNFFGTYVIFILPASIIMYLEEKDQKWLFTTAVIYAGLLVSLTRGVWLAFLPVFLIICILYYKNNKDRRQLIIVVAVLAVVTLTLSSVNDWQLLKRALTVPDAVASAASLYDQSVKAEGSVFERIYTWKETFTLIKENWLFGIGADHLRIPLTEDRFSDKAHNIYLEIAVTMGIFGLASYLAFLFYLLRGQNSKIGFLLQMMVAGYLIQGLFNIDVISIMPLFWIALGLLLANNNPASHNLRRGASCDAL